MTGRSGRRKAEGQPSEPKDGSVSASGEGAAAVAGDVSGVVSTGANATILQQQVFLGAGAPLLVTSAASEDRISLEVIMRGPLRALGFASKFDEAVAREAADPARTAVVLAGIAHDLAGAGYDGHASALQRRAAQAYAAAGQHAEAAALQMLVLIEGILSGRWAGIDAQLSTLRQLRDDQAAGGGEPDAGLAAAISVIEVLGALLQDPALAEREVTAALVAAAQHLGALLDSFDRSGVNSAVLVLVAGASAATIADCAVAAEAFPGIEGIADALARVADALKADPGERSPRLRTRVRLAIACCRIRHVDKVAW